MVEVVPARQRGHGTTYKGASTQHVKFNSLLAVIRKELDRRRMIATYRRKLSTKARALCQRNGKLDPAATANHVPLQISHDEGLRWCTNEGSAPVDDITVFLNKIAGKSRRNKYI